jgi:hypothetical protein
MKNTKTTPEMLPKFPGSKIPMARWLRMLRKTWPGENVDLDLDVELDPEEPDLDAVAPVLQVERVTPEPEGNRENPRVRLAKAASLAKAENTNAVTYKFKHNKGVQ